VIERPRCETQLLIIIIIIINLFVEEISHEQDCKM